MDGDFEPSKRHNENALDHSVQLLNENKKKNVMGIWQFIKRAIDFVCEVKVSHLLLIQSHLRLIRDHSRLEITCQFIDKHS